MKGNERQKKKEEVSSFLFRYYFASQKGNYMILLYSQKCNTNFENILNYYYSVDIYSYCECPFCFSNDFIKWGKYQRGVYFISNGKIVFRSIDIQRVKCKHCRKTHALLPSIIVPYKQPVLDVILSAIDDLPIANIPDFSFDTVIKWKHDFRKLFLPYLKTLLPYVHNIIDYILSHVFDVYYDFFIHFRQLIMMTHSGIKNFVYF